MVGRILCVVVASVTFALLSGAASAKYRISGPVVDQAAEVREGAPDAKTPSAARFRLAANVQPPEKPVDLREAEAPTAPRSLFSLLPFPAAPGAEPSSPSSPTGRPEPSTSWFSTLFGQAPAQPRGTQLPALASRAEIDAMISKHARLNGVPEALVHRIVIRESKYNPRAVGRGGAMGLMQIKTGTARALGYQGGPAGLLDAETNLTYGVKYLAGAYRTADGNHDRAVSHYASGYYYAARRKGTLETASAETASAEAVSAETASAKTPRSSRRRRGKAVEDVNAAPAETPAEPPVRSLFSFAVAPSEPAKP